MSETLFRLFGILTIAVQIYGGQGETIQNREMIRDFPHHVAILTGGHSICGGGIIDERHVLTAAHCMLNENDMYISNIEVSSGVDDLSDPKALRNFVSIILVHQEYVFPFSENDIAILKLASPIFFSSRRKPIFLRFHDVPIFAEVLFAGWGRQNSTMRPKYLRMLKMMVIDPYICSDHLSRRLKIGEMCAIPRDQQAPDPSVGDSGSMLIYNGGAFGIVSSRILRYGKYVTLITTIANHLPWIQKSLDFY